MWYIWSFPGGSAVKNQSAKERDVSSIPGFGISPGGGNSNLLQYPFLGNPMDRGAWQSMELQRVWYELATKQQQYSVGV